MAHHHLDRTTINQTNNTYNHPTISNPNRLPSLTSTVNNNEKIIKQDAQLNITTLRPSIPKEFSEFYRSSVSDDGLRTNEYSTTTTTTTTLSSSHDNSFISTNIRMNNNNHINTDIISSFDEYKPDYFSKQSDPMKLVDLNRIDKKIDLKPLLEAEIVNTKKLNNQIQILRNEKFKLETNFNLLKSVVAKALEMDKDKNLKKSLSTATNLLDNSLTNDLDADAIKLLESYMKEEDLDSDFVKAQLDSAILKSIVNPLEIEVEELRKKVKNYEYQLHITEELKKSNEKYQPEKCDINRLLIKYNIDPNNNNNNTNSDTHIKICTILNDMANCINEKYDFHIYTTALLNNNENIDEENRLLRKNIKKLKSDVNIEREKYHELQNTWKKANETFVEQSITMSKQLDELNSQLYISKKQLNSDQSQSPNVNHLATPTTDDSTNFNLEIDNLIKNLESEKQKLLLKISILKEENTNLSDIILRQKATITELTLNINNLNQKLHENTEKQYNDLKSMEAIIFKLENHITTATTTTTNSVTDRPSLTHEFLDPLGASNIITLDSIQVPNYPRQNITLDYEEHKSKSQTFNANPINPLIDPFDMNTGSTLNSNMVAFTSLSANVVNSPDLTPSVSTMNVNEVNDFLSDFSSKLSTNENNDDYQDKNSHNNL